MGEGIDINTSSTVGLMNVYHIPEFVDRMLGYGLKPQNIEMNNILTFPDYYHMNILPKHIKSMIAKKLDNHIVELRKKHSNKVAEIFEYNYSVFKKYLYSNPQRDVHEIRREFKSMVLKKDKHRKTDFGTALPHLKEWFDSLETISPDNKEKSYLL